MRILLDGTAEVRRRDERAQIVIALLVLRIERQPVDQRRAVRQPLPGPRDAKQGSDDRLYPSRLARLAESHDTVAPVALGHRDPGTAAVTRRLRDPFRPARPFHTRLAANTAMGDKRAVGHSHAD